MWILLLKLAGNMLSIFLAVCIYNLVKVFNSLPNRSVEAGWVAFGVMAEVVLLIEVIIKIITV